jgi:hypothetical protein
MSPEHSAGDELVDGRTDQYSLAIVLYEALELLPPAEDARSGRSIQTYLAQIYTLTGDLDQAVTILRPLLTLPSWITPAELTSDPLWSPLRAHPGFATLTATTP